VSYKIRNSIILGGIFLLTTLVGFIYWKFIQPKDLDVTVQEIGNIERELAQLPQTIEEVQNLTEQYYDTRRKYDSRSKIIPSVDITSETYAYMSRGIDRAGFVKFNMTYNGAAQLSNWGFNIYNLSEGEADFRNLYRFIYYLENGQRLYKIASINLEQNEKVEPETKETRKWIAFTMDLHAYYTGITELATSLAAKSLPVITAPFDPFNPLVLQQLSLEGPVGAIDVNKIQVKAILPGKAFVLLGNELIVLQLGDRVWRGYVSKIDPRQSKVDFVVDEGGIIRRIEKKIQFDQ
jgi:hypothetical protein